MAWNRRVATTDPVPRPNVLSGPNVIPNVLRGTPAAPAAPGTAGPGRPGAFPQRGGGPGRGALPRTLGMRSPGSLRAAAASTLPAAAPAVDPSAHPGDFRSNALLLGGWRLLFLLWTAFLAIGVATSATYGTSDQQVVEIVAIGLVWLLSLPFLPALATPLRSVLDPLARIPSMALPAQLIGFAVALVVAIVVQALVLAALTPA